MEVLCTSTDQTKDLAGRIAEKLKPKDVLALYGDLGSGKTTFTKFLVEALEIDTRVQSPSFVIARKYSSKKSSIKNGIKIVNHIDLYRITNSDELKDLEIQSYFEEDFAITIIEWPEIIKDFLPKRTINFEFEYIDEKTRRVNVSNLS